MARAADQFRSADVTLWALATLGIWGLALFSANITAVVPPGVYAALHASRLSGSTLNQLRGQVATLEAETLRLKREGTELLQRLARSEEASGTAARRIGALEVSIPELIERQNVAEAAAMRPPPDPIDDIATGSIDDGTLQFEVDGGTVTVRQRPLLPVDGEVSFTPVAPMPETTREATTPFALPMPPDADGSSMGVAIGSPVAGDDAQVQWRTLLAEAGPALDGLTAVLHMPEGGGPARLVAGPLENRLSALALCQQLDQVAIACEAVPYAGEALMAER